jgi:glycerol-3-phosphate responsive antiterminator
LPRYGRLPLVFAACDGKSDWDAPAGLDVGLLLRDTDLLALIHRTSVVEPPIAVDLDTIAGLGADEAAVTFVVRRLGIEVVLTRRPQLAACAAELGALGLLQVHAFDSTGLLRSLATHPRQAGVGTAVSPGLVLPHLRPEEFAELPRPILAYGLIESSHAARTILECADSICVRPGAAEAIAHDLGRLVTVAAPALGVLSTLAQSG